MENTLAQKAVSLAISGNWKEALVINQEILRTNPTDLDALNRLSRCYFEMGDTPKALATSKAVLKIDPENTIAIRCLQKWINTKPGIIRSGGHHAAEIFLEESGKTKIVLLLNPGSSDTLSSLVSGQEVKLSAYVHKVSVTDLDGKYIGRLSDDLAARIRTLIKKGCKYQVIIKSADTKNVSVFVRELGNKSGITSFPPEKIDYVSFTPPELVHKDHMVINTEDVAEQ